MSLIQSIIGIGHGTSKITLASLFICLCLGMLLGSSLAMDGYLEYTDSETDDIERIHTVNALHVYITDTWNNAMEEVYDANNPAVIGLIKVLEAGRDISILGAEIGYYNPKFSWVFANLSPFMLFGWLLYEAHQVKERYF